MFLATYGDGLTDAPMPALIDAFRASGKIAHVPLGSRRSSMRTSFRPTPRHRRRGGGHEPLEHPHQRRLLRPPREILDLIEPGDELVEETFERLIAAGELVAYPYDGFFGAMDTIKDRQRLETMHESGQAPWQHLRLELVDPLAV